VRILYVLARGSGYYLLCEHILPPNKNKVRGARGTRRKNKIPRQLVNPSSINYTGPTKLQSFEDNARTTCIQMHLGTTGISSTAGGVISGNISFGNPSSAAAWSAAAALYDEFRVLSCVIEYKPYDRYSAPLAVTTAVVEPVCFIAIDRDSSATPTSVDIITGYESCQMVSLSDPWKVSYKMSGVREAAFVTTASPASSPTRGFLWLSNQISGTDSYFFGLLFVTWIIQFRGVDV
jgi:hypothetical protein